MQPVPLRVHANIMQFCNALDVINGHGEKQSTDAKDDPLPLHKADSLMKLWPVCYDELQKHLPCKKLAKPLDAFKVELFTKLQQGFLDKSKSIKKAILENISVIHAKQPQANHSTWSSLATSIEDFLRLATADVFAATERSSMKSFGEAANIHSKLAFACP